MRTICLLIALAVSPFLAFGQAEKEDVLKMQGAYSKARSFKMQVSLQLYTNAADKQPVQSATGKVMKQEENYYSEMLGRITVVNDHCCLLVDKNQKTILYSVVEKDRRKKNAGNDLQVTSDSAILKGAVLKYITRSDVARTIEIKYANDAQYDRIEMTINPVNYTLTKVVYYYRVMKDLKPAYEKAEISYSGISINSDLPASLFSENAFVKVSKDAITPLGIYAGYEIIDQRKYNKLATESK